MSARSRPGHLPVAEGVLAHQMSYLAVGSGRPLAYFRGFTTTHSNPTGAQRAFELRFMARLAEHFRVYAINRAPGLPDGFTMADVADQHADALRAEFAEPVDVLGVSSGGSVALQLAADHPDAVRRLVVASSGYRLGSAAAAAQMRYVTATAAGRRGSHHLAPFKVRSRSGARLVAGLMWLLDPLLRPADAADMVAFARAEDGFDLGDRLADITAPTLVIAGERDEVYPPEIIRGTAAGVRDGTLLLYPNAGHGGTITKRRFAHDVTSFLEGSAH